MMLVNKCPDCGEPIYVTELSATLGVGSNSCNLCHARYLAAICAITFGIVVVFSWTDAPWSWFVLGFCAICTACWISRCHHLKYPNLSKQIFSRGTRSLALLACAYGLSSVAMVHMESGNWLFFGGFVIAAIAFIALAALIARGSSR